MLVSKYSGEYGRIIIVTESIFSMDGDVTDLRRLVAIKRIYPEVMLYVDEAHAIGVRGEMGMGVAEEQGVVEDMDFLCGTFGKAVASVGAYLLCSEEIRELLVNRMRTLIFTTALPPLNVLLIPLCAGASSRYVRKTPLPCRKVLGTDRTYTFCRD